MSDAPETSDAEALGELRAAARVLLEWEEELAGGALGGAAIPALDLAALASPAEPVARPPEPVAREPERARPAEPVAREPERARPAEPVPREPERARPAEPVAPDRGPAAPLAPESFAPADVGRRLQVLAAEAAGCRRCGLHAGRTTSVFARGRWDTDLAFVGEGPGYHEDQQGAPFVGRAGQLLDRMVAAMGYARDGVYVCNVVKCRPPQNRAPHPAEAGACAPYLEGQLDNVRPKAIVALGRTAAVGLGVCGPDTRGWRGRWGAWRGVPVMPTYHPAFLLRSPQQKRVVWEDLQAVLRRLGRPIPAR